MQIKREQFLRARKSHDTPMNTRIIMAFCWAFLEKSILRQPLRGGCSRWCPSRFQSTHPGWGGTANLYRKRAVSCTNLTNFWLAWCFGALCGRFFWLGGQRKRGVPGANRPGIGCSLLFRTWAGGCGAPHSGRRDGARWGVDTVVRKNPLSIQPPLALRAAP